jgi:hypothetical protein
MLSLSLPARLARRLARQLATLLAGDRAQTPAVHIRVQAPLCWAKTEITPSKPPRLNLLHCNGKVRCNNLATNNLTSKKVDLKALWARPTTALGNHWNLWNEHRVLVAPRGGVSHRGG